MAENWRQRLRREAGAMDTALRSLLAAGLLPEKRYPTEKLVGLIGAVLSR